MALATLPDIDAEAAGDSELTTEIGSEVRMGLPPLDTSIDPSEFASGPATELAPPEDIDAAQIGDYTPYIADDERTVTEDSTVEGRLGGLLSQNNPYIERARTEAKSFANRKGMLNSSMAAGAAEGAAIDRGLPIAQQDAATYFKQELINQGYSNAEAEHLANASIERENLQAGLDQDTNKFNAENTFEAQKINAAEQNKNNFEVLTADLQGQLAGIDNEAAMNLEELAQEYSIIENLDTINGSIYKTLIGEIGSIIATEPDATVAQSKVNALIHAAGVEFEFSNGQKIGGPGTDPGTDPGTGPGTGDPGGGMLPPIDVGGGDGPSSPDGMPGPDTGNTTIGGTLGDIAAGMEGTQVPGSLLGGLSALGAEGALVAAGVKGVVAMLSPGATEAEKEAFSADVDALAEALGVPSAELMGMDLDALQEAINALAPTNLALQEELQQVFAELGAVASPATGIGGNMGGDGTPGQAPGNDAGASTAAGGDPGVDSAQNNATAPIGGGNGGGVTGGGTSGNTGNPGKDGGPPGGDSSCFVAGTIVRLANGEDKFIEEVEIGDELLGKDGEINRVIEFDHPVLGDRELYSINGSLDFVTGEHPFYTQNGWKSFSPDATFAENPDLVCQPLVTGDQVMMIDGSFTTIETIVSTTHDENRQLYNFKLDQGHTYYADGYLVHNKGGAGSGGGVSCFIAGTQVLRADGTLDNIENIEIGAKLMGMDGSINEVKAFDRPELWERWLWTMNDEKEPWFTSEHPFYTTDGWKSLEPHLTKLEMPDLDVTRLKEGDKIIQADGGLKELERYAAFEGEYDRQLYNFILSNTRSYFANGNLVHNVK